LVATLWIAGCGGTAGTTAASGSGSGTGTGSGSGSGGYGGENEFLYSSAYASGGSIYAWQINTSTGVLVPVTGQPFQANVGSGDNNCTVGCGSNLAADPLGRYLYFDYFLATSSGVDSLGVNSSTGALTNISSVPEYPGATGNSDGEISVDPTGQYLYGSTQASSPPGNDIYLFGLSVGSNGELSAVPGSPFVMVQDSSGSTTSAPPPTVSKNYVYANILAPGASYGQGSLEAWSIDGTNGSLSQISLNGGVVQNYPPVVTPSGQFLYATVPVNGYGSGQWDIMPFSIGANGSVTNLTSLAQPLANETEPIELYLVSPSGDFLYAFGHNATYVYQINESTGALTPTAIYSNIIAFQGVIDPTSKYLYVSPNSGPSSNYVSSNTIVGYQINPTTGALTPISGDTVTLPQAPQGIAIVRAQ
jgi:6-phosphogluconolactonase (cycloisomerase 2 family)